MYLASGVDDDYASSTFLKRFSNLLTLQLDTNQD